MSQPAKIRRQIDALTARADRLELEVSLRTTELEAARRNARVEAALERIRTRTMAMRESHEIGFILGSIFAELQGLELAPAHCVMWIFHEDESQTEWFLANPEAESGAASCRVDHTDHPVFEAYLEAWRERREMWVYRLEGELKRTWDEYLFSNGLSALPPPAQEAMRSLEGVYLSNTFGDFGLLTAASHEPLEPEHRNVIQRFGRVFQQSYARFLDVRQAEIQAREARIEAALERVRSRTMAMRHSAEIGSIVGSMFSELQKLDVALARCFIWVFDDEERKVEWFGALPEVDVATMSFKVDYTDHPVHNDYYQAWLERRSMWLYTLGGDLKRSWEDYIFGNGLSALPPAAREGMRGPDVVHLANTFGDFGLLMAGSPEPLPSESLDILQRFGRVFQQSYARFLDIRQAEVGAREARVEAAAERVRVAAMTMQTPDDLFRVVGSIREELFGLDIPHCVAAGVTIVDEDDNACRWDVTKVEGADAEAIITRLEYGPGDVAALDRIVSSWRSAPGWGVEELDYDELLRLADEVAVLNAKTGAYMREAIVEGRIPHLWNGHAGFSHGFVHGDFNAVPGDDARRILIKMAGVFDLAYQRYLDLQVAEASAREARIEAAFERVRARALAMQSSGELPEVALDLRNQMALLGEEFQGIAIHRYPSGEFDAFESWAAVDVPDRSEPVVVKTSLAVSSCEVLREYRDRYESDRDDYTIEVEADSVRGREWLRVLREAAPELRERLEASKDPELSFHNCSDYSGGTIVMVTFSSISEEQRDLLQRAGRVFDLAHQRYLDLAKAEEDYRALLAEKARTETALADLRATQAQLVEQEKLASLGRLTAGIAHEIKNPLNFVNNFAEVSSELADELRQALGSGNTDQAVELLSELQGNSNQIVKHGKRADSIVRSMMLHARGGSSEREEVDLNLFVGEYADLAWHGMRARHQELRAEVHREFDPSVGSITCMPQELGRVLLNLLNNAFDAVQETEDGRVTLRTSRSKERVLIQVCDNGPGIPGDILEKIFEPFFTTKPTGLGTGLGLSLSYDIVTKGHGGKMTASRGEQGGAEFTVSLPA